MIRKIYNKKLKGWRWQIDVQVGRKRHQDSTFLTRKAAEDAVENLRADDRARRLGLPSPLRSSITLKQLIEAREKDLGKETENHRKAIATLNRFAGIVGEDLRVTEISRADIQSYIQAMQAKKLQPASINRHLNDISAAIHAAPRYFRVLAEWKPPTISRVKEPGHGRERVVTLEEFEKWLTELYAINPDLADAILLSWLTGARPGELLRLEWWQVDFERDVILLQATKTKTQRVIPMGVDARGLLESRNRTAKSERVFPANLTKHVIARAVHLAAKQAGLRFGRKMLGGFTWYDIRHTAATAMLRKSDLETVRVLLGHSKKTMTVRYAHASTESQREAMAALSTPALSQGLDRIRHNQTKPDKEPEIAKSKRIS